jgi:hypothetical protein
MRSPAPVCTDKVGKALVNPNRTGAGSDARLSLLIRRSNYKVVAPTRDRGINDPVLGEPMDARARLACGPGDTSGFPSIFSGAIQMFSRLPTIASLPILFWPRCFTNR